MTPEEKQKRARELLPLDLFVNRVLATLLSDYADDLQQTIGKALPPDQAAASSEAIAPVTSMMNKLRGQVVGAPPRESLIAALYLAYDIALYMVETGQFNEEFLKKQLAAYRATQGPTIIQ